MTGIRKRDSEIYATSSFLKPNSPIYSSECDGPTYYYDVTEIYVFRDSRYEFTIDSTAVIGVTLYKNYFDSIDSNKNVLLRHYGGDRDIRRITFEITLQSKTYYDFVVATVNINTTHLYRIRFIGVYSLNFTKRGESY